MQYVRAHPPTFPSLHLRHSSFSNPSVVLPTSQLILQPFFRFSYVTGSSLTSPGEPHMAAFIYVTGEITILYVIITIILSKFSSYGSISPFCDHRSSSTYTRQTSPCNEIVECIWHAQSFEGGEIILILYFLSLDQIERTRRNNPILIFQVLLWPDRRHPGQI